MLDRITFGRYCLRDSVVHKLSPVFKILSLIIMIVGVFFIDSYVDILMLTMYLLLTIVYSDISILVYLKNIYSIKIFLLFILIIDLIFFSGINKVVFDVSIAKTNIFITPHELIHKIPLQELIQYGDRSHLHDIL